jgi:DNA polymerase I-like protein with 3'-5' exonuclease and polymerase domains
VLSLPNNTLIFDTETTGLWPWPSVYRHKHGIATDRPFLFIFTNLEGETISVRAKVDPFTRQVSYKGLEAELNWFRKIVANPDMRVVCHVARVEWSMTIQGDIHAEWNCKIHDTRVMARIANPTQEPNYQLKALAKKYLKIPDEDKVRLKAGLQQARNLAKAKGWCIATKESHGKKTPSEADYWLPQLKDLVKEYGEMDGLRTAGLYRFYRRIFDRNKKFEGRLWEMYRWELRALRTSMDMERTGMTFWPKTGHKLERMYRRLMEEHRKGIDDMGYKSLNLQSPKQMVSLFIDKLGYTAVRKTKGGKTSEPQPKIDNDQLMIWARGSVESDDIDHDAPDGCMLSRHALEWKAGKKVIEYLQSYNYFMCRRSDNSYVIHPAWDISGAKTGRYSCHDPNAQQIASKGTWRRHSHVHPRQRESFGVRPGYYWYVPDYSQIEVWVFAFDANEETMKAALLSGSDFHLMTARSAWYENNKRDFCTCGRWTEVEQEMRRNKQFVLVWEDEKPKHKKGCLVTWWRQRAKSLLFTRFYGGGIDKVAQLIRCTRREAVTFIEQFNENLPGVQTYMDETVQRVRDTGLLVNLFGREYPIDRNFAYKAVNYQIQGSAAEIMKRAIIRVNEHLTVNYPGTWTKDPYGNDEYLGSHVIGTVHDQLLSEIHPDDHSKQLMREMIRLMQADSHVIPNLKVPLPVKMEWTNGSWPDAKEISL